MRGFVANTDYDWFTFLRSIEPRIDEVNFWRPGATRFAALQSGEPVLFRLKAPRNVIGGFGYFSHYSYLPLSVVWNAYAIANGAPDFEEVQQRLLRYRTRFGMSGSPKEDFWLGCILLTGATFFDERDWIREPDDFARNSPPGQSYDLTHGEGQRIWLECLARASEHHPVALIADRPIQGGYGEPFLVRPRYGQKSFRIAVLDAYGRRCAVTKERTLPALEAAHIRDYHDVQTHTLSNGILFRADIHKLFDSGYVTVTPEMRFEVSRRIKEEFENGRDYYQLHGTIIRPPEKPAHRPDVEALSWHNEERYLG
jgi:putative restriction endonuclease